MLKKIIKLRNFVAISIFLYLSRPAPVQNSKNGSKNKDRKSTPYSLSEKYYYWSADGNVYFRQDDIENTVYLGGDFSMLYPNTGNGVMLNKKPHSIPANIKLLFANSSVFTIITDGNGSIYIGGAFTEIENTTRNHLARINADGSLHTWNLGTDGPVYCLAISGNTIFAGGDFTQTGGHDTNNLAAIDAETGNVIVE